ncbi:helix-turn-helix domain-containing protein [Acidithiobacillus sp.]|uniref:helix-turn-helix domain-containing protein n=1 Tax=Acidithiobacillus sp. TaxID=1872118 RepID=UPI003D061182
MQTQPETATQIIAEIAAALGYSPDAVPTQINEAQASAVLGVRPATLCNWRCTGRYALPYIKTGRLVRYRTRDLAEWIARRRTGAEG